MQLFRREKKSPYERLLVRDQPRLFQLKEWNGEIIAKADRCYVVDVDAKRCRILQIKGADEILSIASWGKSRTPVALARQKNKAVLMQKKGAEWFPIPIPHDLSEVKQDTELIANETTLAVYTSSKLFVFENGNWRSLEISADPSIKQEMRGEERNYALFGGDLYIACGAGEWGGALVRLNLSTGKLSQVNELGIELPVSDIKTDPFGTLWVTQGLAHLGGLQGALWKLEKGSFTNVAQDSNFNKKAQGWNLEPASFEALAFDQNGGIYMLTNNLGVVTKIEHEWKLLTPEFLQGAYPTCFTVTNKKLVIGLYDGGILLWDRQRQQVDRIPLH